MALFGFGRARPQNDARRRVESWAREIWAADRRAGDGSFVVKANEIVCADPACPGVETVILILGAGRKTLAFKVPKPLPDVSADDVSQALGQAEEPVPGP